MKVHLPGELCPLGEKNHPMTGIDSSLKAFLPPVQKRFHYAIEDILATSASFLY